jgi:hypothetical protein
MSTCTRPAKRCWYANLRLMCDPAQYLIIDDIDELPKIQRRIANNE